MRASGRRRVGASAAAADRPVARVAVDVSLAHLDRPFDYLVPADQDEAARPGARVRVRFSGRLVDGFVLDRLDGSEHAGRLAFLERVVSAEPVLTSQIAALCRAVADRYAGSMADVVRLAVPPRHARVEAAVLASAPGVAPGDGSAVTQLLAQATSLGPGPGPGPGLGLGRGLGPGPEPAGSTGWGRYPAGPAFLEAVADLRPARAVWQVLPGDDWPIRFAQAAATALRAGRGSLLLVPDAADLALLDAALAATLPPGAHTGLSADLGPAERYRRFLSVLRGHVRVVAGTRGAAFAPVTDLGLLALFDDGDDLYAEQRAPYPHAREVLMMRSATLGCPLLIGGYARTAESQLLLDTGWAHPITADRSVVRAAAPRIEAAGDEYATGADSAAARARLTPAAFAAARAALADGAPVLVQVPRRGYLAGLACARCRRPARCRRCHGPLAMSGPRATPACRWCGVAQVHVNCSACGSSALRAGALGDRRTAEELGRAFPGVALITSAGEQVRRSVPTGPALVVATPGAEPAASGGYGAALLLDGNALLGRPDLRAAEETLRRWMAAAALVRPASAGGKVVVGADASLPTVQALIRWDPAGHAAAELAARAELGFPPAAAMASVQGLESAVLACVEALALPPSAQVLGPVPVDDPGSPRVGGPDEPEARALVRVAPSDRRLLAVALRVEAAARSARKDSRPVRIRVDPAELG